MNERISALLQQIQVLQKELQELMAEQEAKVHYRIEGTRIEFERMVKEAHARLKLGAFRWLCASNLRNVLSAPFIYGMIMPLVLFDVGLTLYQAVCFRLYRIPRVRRTDYITVDRQHLAYLNAFEKLNCMYCGYANGLIAYSREISARTEQYWCPIKHARKILDSHGRYPGFLEYGEAVNMRAEVKKYREAVRQEE